MFLATSRLAIAAISKTLHIFWKLTRGVAVRASAPSIVIRLSCHEVELERYTRTVNQILLIDPMLTPYNIAAQHDLERPCDVSGRQFEEMCLIIYSHQYSDAMFYSRGHLQPGIDLKMREPRADGAARDVLVQCKDTKTLSPSDLHKDIAAALTRWAPKGRAQPDLLYVVATTVAQPDTDGFEATFTKIRDQMIARTLAGQGQTARAWLGGPDSVCPRRPGSFRVFPRTAGRPWRPRKCRPRAYWPLHLRVPRRRTTKGGAWILGTGRTGAPWR